VRCHVMIVSRQGYLVGVYELRVALNQVALRRCLCGAYQVVLVLI